MTRELSKRPYRMKKRAELQERTRRRITESAVELHGTLGPSRTSISAVAAHAGVRRSTLYRHFPDEAALFAACTAHWLDANPQPDLTRWAAIKDPDARLRAGLAELYAYYQQSEGMLANVLRDEATMPTVARMLAFYRDYLARSGDRKRTRLNSSHVKISYAGFCLKQTTKTYGRGQRLCSRRRPSGTRPSRSRTTRACRSRSGFFF